MLDSLRVFLHCQTLEPWRCDDFISFFTNASLFEESSWHYNLWSYYNLILGFVKLTWDEKNNILKNIFDPVEQWMHTKTFKRIFGWQNTTIIFVYNLDVYQNSIHFPMCCTLLLFHSLYRYLVLYNILHSNLRRSQKMWHHHFKHQNFALHQVCKASELRGSTYTGSSIIQSIFPRSIHTLTRLFFAHFVTCPGMGYLGICKKK